MTAQSDPPTNVGSTAGVGLEPAAHVRWHMQNGFDVTEFSGLRDHPEIEMFWGNRKKLALYTADQVRSAVASERERCALACEAEAKIWEEDGKGPAIEARLCAARIRAMKDKP